MEEQPTLTHYVDMICTLFDEFEQEQQNEKTSKRGCPVTFADKMFIVFFIIMQFRRIRAFKAQNRWLKAHPEIRDQLGWERTPHRKTISTRFKRLDATVQQFLQFNAQHAAQLDEAFKLDHLAEDKSCLKHKVLYGIKATAKRGASLTVCEILTKKQLGARVVIMAGCTVMVPI